MNTKEHSEHKDHSERTKHTINEYFTDTANCK